MRAVFVFVCAAFRFQRRQTIAGLSRASTGLSNGSRKTGDAKAFLLIDRRDGQYGRRLNAVHHVVEMSYAFCCFPQKKLGNTFDVERSSKMRKLRVVSL